MSMREMKLRQKKRATGVHTRDTTIRRPDATDDEVVEVLEDGAIEGQQDGTFVVRRGRSADEDDAHDCPDAAPPGWAEP
jgi:hypothetical protein